MNKIRNLSFTAGPIEYGWGGFTIQVDDEVFHCETSNIGLHPIASLVSSCCELFSLYQDPKNLPTFQDQFLFEVATYSEPGGLLITFEPEEEDLIDFRVDDLTNSDDLWISSKTMQRPLRAIDGLISYWQLIHATFKAAANLLHQYGITGFNSRWLYSEWFHHDSREFFPIGHFLFLSQIQQKYRHTPNDSTESSLPQDIEILRTLNLRDD